MILTFTVAFASSVALICALRPAAVRLGFTDAPCDRKQHDGHVPLVGGLAIYLSLLALSLIFPFWRAQQGTWLIALGLPLLLVGLADDRWHLSASKRFAVEIGCSLFAVMYCGIRINDVGHLFPHVGGTLVLLAVPLSVVGMVGVVNAINMADGVDGLAGGLAALTFAALALLSFQANPAIALQLISFMAVLVGFLVFNSRFFGRKRASIFMGDGGSLFVGFALAWYLTMLSQGPEAVIRPVSALWLLAVPLLDTVTIMIRRIQHGRSPFGADREHLHHLLLAAGFDAHRTVLIILSMHFCFILFGIASIHYNMPDWVAFGLFVGVFALYFAGTCRAWKMMHQAQRQNNPNRYRAT